jgi:hypothetical protein
MTPIAFVSNIVLIFIIFIAREELVDLINSKMDLSFKMKKIWLSYLLAVWLVIVTILGMLFNTEQPFGNVSVSGSIEQLEPSESKKPHRFFDINFDIFNF